MAVASDPLGCSAKISVVRLNSLDVSGNSKESKGVAFLHIVNIYKEENAWSKAARNYGAYQVAIYNLQGGDSGTL